MGITFDCQVNGVINSNNAVSGATITSQRESLSAGEYFYIGDIITNFEY